tara:strand:- start:6 stop:221 length:216 start_codon:yes stop_codon:yes gene_type:complete
VAVKFESISYFIFVKLWVSNRSLLFAKKEQEAVVKITSRGGWQVSWQVTVGNEFRAKLDPILPNVPTLIGI